MKRIFGAATTALTLFALSGSSAWARQTPELLPTLAKDGRATLPSGTVVELVGLTDDVRAGILWWKLDGKPLSASPVELAPRGPGTLARGQRRVALAVRLTPSPGSPVASLKIVTALFDSARKLAPLAFSVVEPKRPPGTKLVEFSAPSEARTALLRLGVETTPGRVETAEFRAVPLRR